MTTRSRFPHGFSIAWAIVLGIGAAALGCKDPRQAIAREEPAALSLGADGKPGGDPAAPPVAPPPAPPQLDVPPLAAPAPNTAPDDMAAADADEEPEDVEEARPPPRRRASTRSHGRRRRPLSTAGDHKRDPHPNGAASKSASAAARKGRPERAHGAEPSAATAALKVRRLVVARGVSRREPVGPGKSFAAADLDKIYAFVEISNDARAESAVTVAFVPPGGGAGQRIKLDVGAERRWRTWAVTRRVRAAGTWTVTVTDAAGAVIGRTAFTVTK